MLKSPYLLGISLFVILLASVNTFLYFEQLRLVSETFTDNEQRTQVFARLDYIVQGLTVLLQLFITGREYAGPKRATGERPLLRSRTALG